MELGVIYLLFRQIMSSLRIVVVPMYLEEEKLWKMFGEPKIDEEPNTTPCNRFHWGMQIGRIRNRTMVDSDQDSILIAWFRILIRFRFRKNKCIEGSEIGSNYGSGDSFES